MSSEVFLISFSPLYGRGGGGEASIHSLIS